MSRIINMSKLNKVRLLITSGALAVMVGLVFTLAYFGKLSFRADTTPPVNAASVSYIDSNNTNTAVNSNPINLIISAPTDPKAIIENEMTTVVQIANACKTYAGESKVNIAHQTNMSDPPADGGVSLQAGNQPICDTSTITDPAQKAQATGNYPKLPDGYSYYIYRDFDMSFSSFVIVRFSPTTQGDIELPLLHCDYSGCTKENGW